MTFATMWRVLICMVMIGLGILEKANAQENRSIKGKIVDEAGNSLPGAVVQVENLNRGTVTELDGTFQFDNLPIGPQTLRVTYLGFQESKIQVEIPFPNNKPLEIKLKEDKRSLGEITVRDKFNDGSETRAINMTKTANRVITVISSETIAKLPTRNAAEAVKRAPGAAIQNSKGEGSFISLRGTPGDWTSTLVNGDRLPVADEENTSRSFEFEVLPSDLVDMVILSRTVTPDIEADNIGGSINFTTKTPPDSTLLRLNLAGGWNAMAQKPLGLANIVYGGRSKNKKLGFLTNLSYYGRNYAAQANKVIYSNNFNQAIASYELRNYNGVRHTIGANLSLDYTFSPKLKIGGNFLYGSMIDDKNQKKVRYNYSDGSGQRIRLQTINGILKRQLVGGDVFFNWNPNSKVKTTLRLASYSNDFRYGNAPFKNNDPRNGYFFVEFMSPLMFYKDQDFIDYRTGGAIDPSSPDKFLGKTLAIDNPYGTGDDYQNIQPQPVNALSPDQKFTAKDFEFAQAFSQLNHTWEKDPIVAQWDMHVKLNDHWKLQMGLKHRSKQGSRSIKLHKWVQKTTLRPASYNLSEFQTEDFSKPDFYLNELGNPYDSSFYQFLTKNQLLNFIGPFADTLLEYEMNPLNQEFRFWAGSQYHYNENQEMGYAMAEWKWKEWTIVGGFRIEYTMLKEYSDTLLDTLLYDVEASTYYRPTEERATTLNYFAFLPSLNASFALNQSNNFRLAVSRTFHRPNFEETKPGYGVYDIDNLSLVFGNSTLKPTYSYNADLLYEHYWGNKGLFSIGGYFKYVTDHIFASTTSFVDEFGIVAKQYQNAPKSWVGGIELNLQRQFDFLPKFWSGFGASGNITYSWSQMQVPGRTFKQAMTEQTPLLYNVALFYEKNRWNVRVGLNYNGPMLKELNLFSVKDLDGQLKLVHQDTQFDVYRGPNYALDFSASFKISKHFLIYGELTNLLNYPDLTYRGRKERPIRTEYYRTRGQIGIKFDL
jgi:TonB-dependent receptor